MKVGNRRFTRMLAGLGAVLALVGAIGCWSFFRDLKVRLEPELLRVRHGGVSIYSRPVLQRAGRRIATDPLRLADGFGPALRRQRHAAWKDFPPCLVQAVLTEEDEGFFDHSGLDLPAIVRAAAVNLVHWEIRQGGSTLTQQFVKNYFLDSERTFFRKLKEAVITLFLERQLSKEEIFELYANNVYLGQSGSFAIVGFAEGAETYFGKSLEDLELHEAATLAAMIKAPNRFSPYRHQARLRERRDRLLERMSQNSFVSSAEVKAAQVRPLEVEPPGGELPGGTPYFADYVREQLPPGRAEGSWKVFTTLDPGLQEAAMSAVEQGAAGLRERFGGDRPVPEIALVAVDPRSGEILAMVGGTDYGKSQYNRAVHARRQVGSTFKPFVFAAAFERPHPAGLCCPVTLSTRFTDEPYTLVYGGEAYSPGNYRDEYLGPVTLRDAIAFSINIPTLKLAESIGFEAVAETAGTLTRIRDIAPYPSLALGSLDLGLFELAGAYAAFASHGRLPTLHGVAGYEGEGRWEDLPFPEPEPVISPETAFLVTAALRSVIEEGTARAVRSSRFFLPAAGKTGSSEDDSWFVGYTPDLVCAVWVGFDHSEPLGLTGAQAALPVWIQFMRSAERVGYLSGAEFEWPESIVAVEIDPQTGLLASQGCDQVRTEFYIRGTEPREFCRGIAPPQLAGGPVKVHKEPGKGFWGWLRKVF